MKVANVHKGLSTVPSPWEVHNTWYQLSLMVAFQSTEENFSPYMVPKVCPTKEKKDTLDFQIKNFCFAKDSVMRMERQDRKSVV